MRERILSRCIPEPNSGCWLWLGVLNATTGYGYVSCGRRNSSRLAHRVSAQKGFSNVKTDKIMKLTPEQERELPKFREAWRAIGIRTGHDAECEREGREAVLDAHKEIGAKPPLVVWARSPMEALLMGDQLEQAFDKGTLSKRTFSTKEKRVELEAKKPGDRLRAIWNRQWSWGQVSGYWVAWYRFALDIGVKTDEQSGRRLRLHERLARACYGVISLGGIEVLIQHPTVAVFDTNPSPRLHRTDGPALQWSDGYAVYAVHGVRLTPEVGAGMAAGTLTAKEISEHPNAEVRRVLVDVHNKGDTGRYLRELGAKVVHEDMDALGLPRRLLRIDQADDEPIVAIEVTNSTPEPDGTWKKYTFRCHPQLRPFPVPGIRDAYGEPQAMTCQNAIASTYGYKGEDFTLEAQT